MFRNALILTTVISSSAFGYVTGYDRLYNPETKVTIELLHDLHAPQVNLSGDEVYDLPFAQIKSELFSTEQRVLDAFAVLNEHAADDLDVIWEEGIRNTGSSVFLSFCENRLGEEFPNLSFVPSDLSRDAFERLLLDKRGNRSIDKEYLGVSFGNPLPFSDTDMAVILSQYGDETLQAYERLRKRVVNTLAERYLDRFLTGTRFKEKDFENYDFHELADAEMLRNILSSRKSRIILYAGGWHSEGIGEFLTTHAGFEPLERVGHGSDGEIDANSLASLDAKYRLTPWKNTKTGSSYAAQKSVCPDCGRSWKDHG